MGLLKQVLNLALGPLDLAVNLQLAVAATLPTASWIKP